MLIIITSFFFFFVSRARSWISPSPCPPLLPSYSTPPTEMVVGAPYAAGGSRWLGLWPPQSELGSNNRTCRRKWQMLFVSLASRSHPLPPPLCCRSSLYLRKSNGRQALLDSFSGVSALLKAFCVDHFHGCRCCMCYRVACENESVLRNSIRFGRQHQSLVRSPVVSVRRGDFWLLVGLGNECWPFYWMYIGQSEVLDVRIASMPWQTYQKIKNKKNALTEWFNVILSWTILSVRMGTC